MTSDLDSIYKNYKTPHWGLFKSKAQWWGECIFFISKERYILKKKKKIILKLFPLTFTGHAIYVTELVATATVTLVGAVHIGTLLTAWVGVTFIQIYTETKPLQTTMNSVLTVN